MDVADVHEALANARRVLAVSPHLDDAVLSAGATLASWVSRGAQVTVLTLFAGYPTGPLSPVAVRHHRRCRLPADADQAITVRRTEDEQAVTTLGATHVHAEHLDVVYRRGLDGQWACRSDEDMFGTVPLDERLLCDVGTTIIRTMLRTRADLLLAPAAVGHHVDHVMSRDMAIDVAGRTRTAVLLWKDQPYGRDRPASVFSPAKMDQRLLETKAEAAGLYVSQLPMLWPDGSWREALTSVPEEFLLVSID